jgi:hypothetical protein
MNIAEIREKYPQYADLSDDQLAQGLHKKYYSDMPFSDFASKIGMGSAAPIAKGPTSRPTNPLRDVSGFGRAVRGAKTAIQDMSLGVHQRLADLGTALGKPGFAEEGQALRQEAAQDRLKSAKLMETTGGQVGYVGGALAPAVAASFIPGANTITGAAAYGAVTGAVQPVTEGESVARNAGVGAVAGAVGQGLFKGVGRLAEPVKNAGSKTYQKSVDVLERAGIKLNAAQKTDSGALKQVQRYVANNPFTQPKEAARIASQRSQYTKAVLKTINADGTEASEATIKDAAARIVKPYDEILPKHSFRPSSKVLGEMDTVSHEARLALGADNGITRIIDDIKSHVQQNGKITGEYYKSRRTMLLGMQREAGVSPHAVKLREGLDKVFKNVIGPDEAARLTEADKLYSRLVKIEKAIDPDGSINPAKLWNAVNDKAGRRATQRGTGDKAVAQLARAGKNVLIEKMPDSGTASRVGLQAAPAAIGGGLGYLTGDNPEEAWRNAAIGAGALYALPKAAQYGLGSNYISRGIPNSAAREALQLPAERGLGLGVPAYLLSQE